MEPRPSLCPSCGAFVRHDWTDTCGRCSASLIEAPAQGTADAAQATVVEPGPSWALPGAVSGAPQATAPTLTAAPATHTKLVVVLVAIGIVVALVAGTTVIMAGELDNKTAAIATTTPPSTTSTSVKPPSDLGQQFTAGLASSKRFAINNLPTSGGNLTSAQLAKTTWTHFTDAKCKCSADFPYSPLQETGYIDGNIPVHQVYSVSTTSPIGLAIMNIDIGPNVSLGDNDLKNVAAAYTQGLRATSITSSNVQTIDGSRGVLVRAVGDTHAVASAFQHGNVVYVVVAFSVNPADDPLPVYNKLIESFSTSVTA